LIDLLSEVKTISLQAYNSLDVFFTEVPGVIEDYPPLSRIFAHKGAVVTVSFLLDMLTCNTGFAKYHALSLIYDIAANIKYQWGEVGVHMVHVLEAYRLITDSTNLLSSLLTHPNPSIQRAAKDTLDWINYMPE
jgi:hypothetical protein